MTGSIDTATGDRSLSFQCQGMSAQCDSDGIIHSDWDFDPLPTGRGSV